MPVSYTHLDVYKRQIHTCLDTSGATFRPEDAAALAQFDALCAVTDLVLLDIKQTDPAAQDVYKRQLQFAVRMPIYHAPHPTASVCAASK